MTHHPSVGVMAYSVSLQLILALYYAWSGCPRGKDQRFWTWLLRTYLVLKTVSLYLFWSDRVIAYFACCVAADTVIQLIWHIDIGKWKKRWGKIKSAALTAVNQASFRNQQKEAFS